MSPLRPDCPCGRPTPYDACCGRLHRGAAQALTAEELMRSRYAAYALGDLDHVFRTWHPRTRPDDLTGGDGVTWTGLTVLDVEAGEEGDATGEVEFRATYTDVSGGGRTLHERSDFVRRGGRWVYVGPT